MHMFGTLTGEIHGNPAYGQHNTKVTSHAPIIFMHLSYFRVPKLPGKPGILSFTFPGLENVWNLLKN